MTSKKLTDLERTGVQHIIFTDGATTQAVTGIPQYGMLNWPDWTESKDRKVRLEDEGILGALYDIPNTAVIVKSVRKYFDGEVVPVPELPEQAPSAGSSLSEELRALAARIDAGSASFGTDLRVIVTGNIIDGMFIWGPFDGPDAADWAHNEFPDSDWLQVVLLPPYTEESE